MGQIILSSDLSQYSGKSEDEFRLALAIFLYSELKVPAGKAGQVAGMSRIEFWEELGKRNVPINYDVDDFEQDLENIRRFRSKNPSLQ
jgi:predicted HTH domain antitoxin